MSATTPRQSYRAIIALGAVVAFSLSANCADTQPTGDFIPSFEREWLDEATTEMYTFDPAPNGTLSGLRISSTGQQQQFTGTYDGLTLNLTDQTGTKAKGQFLDPDTIQLEHPNGHQQTLHRTDE